MDTRERFLKEFGESSIFGNYDRKPKEYNNIINNEFRANIKQTNQWNDVKDFKEFKPKGYKPSAQVKNDANFMKSTESKNNHLKKK